MTTPGASSATAITDVAVIGAGVAGLAAARALHDAGVATVVLEARHRLGGRIYTRRAPPFGLPMELGAEFLHGQVRETLDVADEAQLVLCEITGDWWRADRGALRRPGETDGHFQRLMARLDRNRTPDRSFAEFLDSMRADPQLADAVPQALQYVQGFDAADPGRVSERWLALAKEAAQRDGQDRQFRVTEGYDRVPAALAAPLPADALRRSTIVREIEWRRGHAMVYADAVTVAARAVIITVPLGVLTAAVDGTPGPITFRPDYGRGVRRALTGLAMGSALHLSLRFREPLWEALEATDGSGDLTALSFLLTADAEFPVWWTAYPLRAPVLTAWVGGPRAARLADYTCDELADRALAALARHTGLARERADELLVDVWYHDWQHDPLARGAYSYGVVGGTDAPRILGQPVDNTLFFAGEATDPDGRGGTVHGAIASGYRAAAAVRTALRS